MCKWLDWLESLFGIPDPRRNRLWVENERRVYRMGSLEIPAETKDEALRQAARAVFEGYEAPLNEAGGAWTDVEVWDALMKGDFDR